MSEGKVDSDKCWTLPPNWTMFDILGHGRRNRVLEELPELTMGQLEHERIEQYGGMKAEGNSLLETRTP